MGKSVFGEAISSLKGHLYVFFLSPSFFLVDAITQNWKMDERGRRKNSGLLHLITVVYGL